MKVTATIQQSGSVSGDIDLRKMQHGIVAIGIPACTSGDLYVQGGFDTTSADFRRLLQPVTGGPQSGDLIFAIGPGSRMVLWPGNVRAPEYIRLETAVPQAAARSFSILWQ